MTSMTGKRATIAAQNEALRQALEKAEKAEKVGPGRHVSACMGSPQTLRGLLGLGGVRRWWWWGVAVCLCLCLCVCLLWCASLCVWVTAVWEMAALCGTVHDAVTALLLQLLSAAGWRGMWLPVFVRPRLSRSTASNNTALQRTHTLPLHCTRSLRASQQQAATGTGQLTSEDAVAVPKLPLGRSPVAPHELRSPHSHRGRLEDTHTGPRLRHADEPSAPRSARAVYSKREMALR